jgi:hypothetical protein
MSNLICNIFLLNLSPAFIDYKYTSKYSRKFIHKIVLINRKFQLKMNLEENVNLREDLIYKLLNNKKNAPNKVENAETDLRGDPNDLLSNLTPEQIQILSQLYANQENNAGAANNADGNQKSFKEFLPVPGFCLKTKNDQDQKLFLNICTSDEINAPPDIGENDLLKIIDQEDSAFQYRIPMSLGEPHSETDNCNKSNNQNSVLFNFFILY